MSPDCCEDEKWEESWQSPAEVPEPRQEVESRKSHCEQSWWASTFQERTHAHFPITVPLDVTFQLPDAYALFKTQDT